MLLLVVGAAATALAEGMGVDVVPAETGCALGLQSGWMDEREWVAYHEKRIWSGPGNTLLL